MLERISETTMPSESVQTLGLLTVCRLTFFSVEYALLTLLDKTAPFLHQTLSTDTHLLYVNFTLHSRQWTYTKNKLYELISP